MLGRLRLDGGSREDHVSSSMTSEGVVPKLDPEKSSQHEPRRDLIEQRHKSLPLI